MLVCCHVLDLLTNVLGRDDRPTPRFLGLAVGPVFAVASVLTMAAVAAVATVTAMAAMRVVRAGMMWVVMVGLPGMLLWRGCRRWFRRLEAGS